MPSSCEGLAKAGRGEWYLKNIVKRFGEKKLLIHALWCWSRLQKREPKGIWLQVSSICIYMDDCVWLFIISTRFSIWGKGLFIGAKRDCFHLRENELVAGIKTWCMLHGPWCNQVWHRLHVVEKFSEGKITLGWNKQGRLFKGHKMWHELCNKRCSENAPENKKKARNKQNIGNI